MLFGILSGILWALDTTILSIALSMAPFSDNTVQAIAFAAITSSALHDILCAFWMALYMGAKGRIKETLSALRTKSGKIVLLGALLGGPIGMTGYVIAINNIGPAYTAIISAFYPAFGTLLAALLLKERLTFLRMVSLGIALLAIVGMSLNALDMTGGTGNPEIGVVCALLCVIGWGSEAVLCAWGMRDTAVDNEIALQIRETTSAIVYAFVVLPAFGACGFIATAIPTFANTTLACAALAGTASYLFYYKAISKIGAAKGMALNISYSAWAVCFGFVLLNQTTTITDVVYCIIILTSTILAATDWKELCKHGIAK